MAFNVQHASLQYSQTPKSSQSFSLLCLTIRLLKQVFPPSFQNVDVLENFTIPNVRRNEVQSSTKFFSGDWDSFVDSTSDRMYDYILCSEVLYSPSSYSKLKNLFERKLRPGGQMYPFGLAVNGTVTTVCDFVLNKNFSLLATKSYYFGVGGSAHEFKQFLTDTKMFSCQTVWKTNEGKLLGTFELDTRLVLRSFS